MGSFGDFMKLQITLTPAESKKLIAKAVVELDVIKKALKNGIIAITLGTTNRYVAEALLKKPLPKEKFVAGLITEYGTCATIASERATEVILKNGEPYAVPLDKVVREMDSDDVFIKGANAIDPNKNVGILMMSLVGGKIGRNLGVLISRGVNIIIPVGLEKLIPVPISEASKEVGITKMDYSMGAPVGLMPIVSGKVITEIEAIEILTGAQSIPIGAGGLSGAGGSITFVVKGTEEQIKKTIELIEQVKGEKAFTIKPGVCTLCEFKHCPFFGVRERRNFIGKVRGPVV